MQHYPQVMENVPVRTKELPVSVDEEVERLNEELGHTGRFWCVPRAQSP